MKKIILSLLLVIFMTACDNKQEQSINEKPVVKVGVSLPLTGNLSPIGNSIKNALIMAQKKVPANSKYEYKIIFDDDSYELRKIASNTNRQISMEKVDAILSLFDGAAAVISPIAEKKQIPNIGCTWGADFFKDYSYSFNHWSRPETQANAFGNLLKDRNINSIAIMMINYASSQEMVQHVKRAIEDNNNIKITSINIINNGTRDFRLMIEKIKEQNPDVIMLQMLDPELGIFTKQANEAKLNIPYVAIDQLQTAQNKELLEGAEFVLSLDGTKEFKNELAKNGDLPAYSCVANLYDAFNLLVKLYEDSDKKPSGEQIKEMLYNVEDFPSSLGILIKVDGDGIIDSPLIRAKIKNGEVIFEE